MAARGFPAGVLSAVSRGKSFTAVFRDGASGNALASLSENAATGTLRLKNQAQQNISGSLINRGAIDLSSSATLSLAGGFTQLQGSTHLDNGFLATGGGAEFAAGELTGNDINDETSP